MSENWIVSLRDDVGQTHVVRVSADNLPQAKAEAMSRIHRPALVKRAVRDLKICGWGS